MKVTLTFDNGPRPEATPLVLDVLDRAKVPASFFLVGKNVETPEGRQLVQRIVDRGHFIGNHSYSHTVPLGRCDKATAVDEIARAQEALAGCGITATHFRPFGGGGLLNADLLHAASVDYLQAQKMTCITWNCVPRDWADPSGWADRALLDIPTRDWTVLVLHDSPTTGMENLAGFLERASAMGVRFVDGFPDDCRPIDQGRLCDAAHGLVSSRVD